MRRRWGLIWLLIGAVIPSRAAVGATVAEGMALYNELGCSGCHQDSGGLLEGRGPDLAEVSRRLNPQWVRALLDGSEPRPIPHVMDGATPGDLDAVLVALGNLETERPIWRVGRHSNGARGEERYRALGCVACHSTDPIHDPSLAREDRERVVAFPNLREKYSLVSLTEFLKNPGAARPHSRMPDFRLDAHDAEDIAGYLWGFEGSDPGLAPPVAPYPQGDEATVARGRDALREAGCAQCHDGLGIEPGARTALAPIDAERLRGPSWPCAVDYALRAEERASLAAFASTLGRDLEAEVKVDSALREFRCLACHERDGMGGPDTQVASHFQGNGDLGAAGRFPPPLTRIGRKLSGEALHGALTGAASLRPYLQVRMPNFGALAEPLVEALALVDGAVETGPQDGAVDAGKILLGTDGGLGCIGCHAWGSRPSLGIPGPDISQIATRWRADWVREYLVDPAAYRPGTLMPSFWPGGRASNREVLGGDTAAQIAAILAFAAQGAGEPSGYPPEDAAAFELIPTDGPIVQRAFLEGVGTEAVLVGFPEGVHLAYDAATAQPRLLWRGRFFDATSTWFSRFAPFEKPLGAPVAYWPQTLDEGRRFLGYRIETDGSVVFVVERGGERFEDRYRAASDGLLRYWSGPESGLDWAHPDGVTVLPLDVERGGGIRYQWEAR